MDKTLNKIVKRITQFPGSILLIPMMISPVINSFLPGLTMIGDPVTSLLNGSGVMTLLFIMLFSSGMQLDVKKLNQLLKKSFVIIVVRVVLVTGIYLLYTKLFDNNGIANISGLVLLIALCSTNPGIFIALIGKYGDQDDLSLFGPLNILTLPAIPLTILSLNSSSSIDINQFIALLLPFVIGVVVGNLRKDIKEKFRSVNPIILCFWGFGIGSKLNLSVIMNDLLSSTILVVLFYILVMLPLILIEEKVYGNKGLLSIASCSVAAVSLIIPQMAAEMNEMYSGYVSIATNQLGFAVVVTSLITPLFTKIIMGSKKDTVLD